MLNTFATGINPIFVHFNIDYTVLDYKMRNIKLCSKIEQNEVENKSLTKFQGEIPNSSALVCAENSMLLSQVQELKSQIELTNKKIKNYEVILFLQYLIHKI